MGKLNMAFLYGRVTKPPIISRNKETGDEYAMLHLDVIRSLRNVDDDVNYVRHDYPVIISREKEIIDEMEEWKENSVVLVKGVVTTRPIDKHSHCPNPECQNEDGTAFDNVYKSLLVYITPIYVKHEADFETKQEAINHLVENREISNQMWVMGRLVTDPKFITTKAGLQITQYKIALNRKFTIRTDDPEIRSDYPIVKSYGEQAINDKVYLQYEADVIIDGFLQARKVSRKQTCACCGKDYVWKDHVMELIPYDVEYVSGFKTKEQVEAEHQQEVENIKQSLFDKKFKNDELGDEFKSDDIDAE